MNIYHIIYLRKSAVVRRADEGISDAEWEAGARVLNILNNTRMFLIDYIIHNGYELCNEEGFSMVVNGGLEDYSPSNHFIKTNAPWDKAPWEVKRESC